MHLSRILLLLLMVFAPFLMDNPDALRSPIYRLLICGMLVGCARVYYDFEKLISRNWKTAILLLALVWNNYYELGKIAEHAEGNDLYERVLFIVAGTIAMAEYVKREKAARSAAEKQRLPGELAHL